jgi:hypothetical protein
MLLAIGVLAVHCEPSTNLKPALTSGIVEITSDSGSPDLMQGLNFQWKMTQTGRHMGNPVNLTEKHVGMRIVVYFVQDVNGGKTITNWGNFYKFPILSKRPVLSIEPNAIDRIDCFIRAVDALDCVFAASWE